MESGMCLEKKVLKTNKIDKIKEKNTGREKELLLL